VTADAPLILASGSSARAAILRQAGVSFEVKPAAVDEEPVFAALAEEGAGGRDVADALAELKARRASMTDPERLVLAADQVMACGDRLYMKPADLAEARTHLESLRAKTHTLYSAAVAARGSEILWRQVDTAKLTMRPFTDAFLDRYLSEAGDSVLSSVGAYRLEGLGAQLFARIDGSYFTILGLPLFGVLDFLRVQKVLDT
jgi:septum formation protein